MSSEGGPSGKPQSGGQGGPDKAEYGGLPPTANWRRYLRITTWTVLVLLIALLLVRNSQLVTVDFVFFEAEVRLFVALAVAIGLGLLLGLSFGWLTRRRYDKKAIAAAKAKKK